MNKQILVIIAALTSVPVSAKIITLRQNKQSFVNDTQKCRRNQSCSLKRIDFQTQDQKVILSDKEGTNFISKMAVSFETDIVEDLEKYAVVQFIKGCLFESFLDKNGNVVKRPHWGKKESFNQSVNAHFTKWIIDSRDRDPVFYSTDIKEFKTRHGYYRWNSEPNSFNSATEFFVMKAAPQNPRLYVKDMPSTSFLYESPRTKEETAFNNSYIFKTCLYKTKDVPVVTTASNINFATPIHCFEWSNSFIYDFKDREFKSPMGLDPYCLTEAPKTLNPTPNK